MSIEFKVGDVVVSRSGHDKNQYFLVLSIDKNGYLGIINGRERKTTQPKRKNPKHVARISHDEKIIEKINSGVYTEAEIYRMIKVYKKVKE